jgi:hypothetical protein
VGWPAHTGRGGIGTRGGVKKEVDLCRGRLELLARETERSAKQAVAFRKAGDERRSYPSALRGSDARMRSPILVGIYASPRRGCGFAERIADSTARIDGARTGSEMPRSRSSFLCLPGLVMAPASHEPELPLQLRGWDSNPQPTD